MFDLLIRNGKVVLPEETINADIAINGEKIAAIGNYGSLGIANEEYDADGKFILPGLIDPHVHMKHPFREHFAADDFYTTTVSAAFGGTTTIIDFAIQWDKDKSIEETILNRRKEAESDVVVDFGLHATPTKSNQETIDSVSSCLKLGIPSYKVYMIYRDQGRIIEDSVLFGLLESMRIHSGLLMVHAENSSIAEFNRDKYINEGKINSKYFPEIKPNFVEVEAISRAIYFNRVANSSLYIAHLSTGEGYELIKSAQKNGELVYSETCPHYLLLTKDVYEKDDGANYICSPPLRTESDKNKLWMGIEDGTISIVSSDHCGFSLEQKSLGNGDFSKTPNGLPGIETRLSLIYTEGVRKKRISINQMTKVLSVNAAKIFGLYPNKGSITPGFDADLCIFDGDRERIITANQLHGAVNWTPYEGMKVFGSIWATLLRGKFIVRAGKLHVNRGYGKFIKRSISHMGVNLKED